MSTEGLFDKLFRILDGDNNYFISGSLSFLPLLDNYRKPGHDLDAAIWKNTYIRKSDRIKEEGQPVRLRLSEVAVANTAKIPEIADPLTGFIHLENDEGLLDIMLYRKHKKSISMNLGFGFNMHIRKNILEKSVTLEWKGYRYKAAPMELMFLLKSVEFLRCLKNGENSYTNTKHYEDIKRMAEIVDWNSLDSFIKGVEIKWLNLPTSINNLVNPIQKIALSIDLNFLKDNLVKNRH